MDAPAVERLHEILKRQYAAHEELRRVLLLQQQAVRRFDAAGLDGLRERGDILAQRIAEMESSRKALTGPDARVAEIAQQQGEPRRSQLVALALGLRKLAEEIASLSRINGAAVRSMLNHFHSVYRMLAGANKAAVYGASGESVDGNGDAFLVDAVA
ncbi:MAG: flagellar protein FlgN [Planctomycetes bacterium]|nr:flagellar protein FlgN [Planctomycetota bacterium]